MIQVNNNCLILDTKNTTYCFRVMESGHLEHLYYGRKITLPKERESEALIEKHVFLPGNTNVYCAADRKEYPAFSSSIPVTLPYIRW